ETPLHLILKEHNNSAFQASLILFLIGNILSQAHSQKKRFFKHCKRFKQKNKLSRLWKHCIRKTKLQLEKMASGQCLSKNKQQKNSVTSSKIITLSFIYLRQRLIKSHRS